MSGSACLVNASHPCRFHRMATRDLIYWAYLRHIERVPTMELLLRAGTPLERLAVSAVALLDLEEETLLRALDRESCCACRLMELRAMVMMWKEALGQGPKSLPPAAPEAVSPQDSVAAF